MGDALPLDNSTSVFLPGMASARLARRWAGPVLARWSVDGDTADAVLVVSELVTNAVAHGSGDVSVTLARFSERLRIEVHDQGDGQVTSDPAPLEATGGRGVYIVSQVADRWGVDCPAGGGKTVWAEFRL